MIDYDEDDVRVHMFYLGGKLYAWTTSKKRKSEFLSQRNRSVFEIRKKWLDPITLKAFRQKYKDQELVQIPLDSKQGDLEIIATYAEDTRYGDYLSQIVNDLEDLIDYFDDDPHLNEELPSKYRKAVETLLQIFTKERKPGFENVYVRTDGVSVFFNLFKNTF